MKSNLIIIILSLIIGLVSGLLVGHYLVPGLVSTEKIPETTNNQITNPASETTEKTWQLTLPTASSQDQLISPQVDEVITNPVLVAGYATAFENTIFISVYDADGQELGKQLAYAHSADIGQPGPFVILVTYQQSATPYGKIKVWEESARDGSQITILEADVRFQESEQLITCQQATEKVLALSEVKDYLAQVPQAKVECDSRDNTGAWLIHVYEIAEEPDGPSHTATFDWYQVTVEGEVKSTIF